MFIFSVTMVVQYLASISDIPETNVLISVLKSTTIVGASIEMCEIQEVLFHSYSLDEG